MPSIWRIYLNWRPSPCFVDHRQKKLLNAKLNAKCRKMDLINVLLTSSSQNDRSDDGRDLSPRGSFIFIWPCPSHPTQQPPASHHSTYLPDMTDNQNVKCKKTPIIMYTWIGRLEFHSSSSSTGKRSNSKRAFKSTARKIIIPIPLVDGSSPPKPKIPTGGFVSSHQFQRMPGLDSLLQKSLDRQRNYFLPSSSSSTV